VLFNLLIQHKRRNRGALDKIVAKKLGGFKNLSYLCSMKKEIGKWFMDVAKYIATAVLLTQIFGGMADSVFIIVYALISVVVIFALGVSIIHSDDEDIKRRERNRNRKDRK
jgi:hypothetical protein